ncbi:carotenoid 1,2-hydratase [Marinobacterium rhizophilum]|uniref:Carotenoid 1,2-hydratase n=2 Tax=Marinobacterium rhizophilum TaxID=420402 RepID=A0ABY5HQU5_9GAMM|nr:carotenoid 1,2-hydratase [Marinobacterium rhizophilum]
MLLAGCEPPPTDALSGLLSAPVAPTAVFAQARPGTGITLPQDLGSHPAYRLEWWYLTANLHSAAGDAFGVQWTLFRASTRGRNKEFEGEPRPVGWYSDELWLAHAALSQPGQHRFVSRLARGGSGQAGATAQPFAAWIDDWQLAAAARDAQSHEGGQGWTLQAHGDDFAYRLHLLPSLAPVLHGDNGFSAKSVQGGGSMYFSYPGLAVSGDLTVDGVTHEVSGQGWFDREWSSQLLQPDQQGWDWLALHLDDGQRLMLFRVRGETPFYAASLIQADGSAQALAADEFVLAPLGYRDSQRGPVPVRWRVELPGRGIELEVSSWPGDYWNPGRLSYWEGPVQVNGSHQGEGYLEMTGYGD